MFLAIVGSNDSPLYQLVQSSQLDLHLCQFICYASLDSISIGSIYQKQIDKFKDVFVSAYVTFSGILEIVKIGTKFVYLHSVSASANSENIKSFFIDLHELYVKILLNPLYTLNSRIDSSDFDAKVGNLAKKWL